MVVRAEIVTGEKSVLRYLLKPIYRSFDLVFSER
jgi:HlyD family secretion protein/adhesin transport system membrane fusion protein